MSFELIPAISISSSGLEAERKRMEVTANNIANVNSTRDANGEPFRKKVPVFAEIVKDKIGESPINELGGVKLEEVVNSSREPIEVYMPYHPDASDNGMVKMPNISPIEEMIDMISANRAYQANLSVIKQSRKMADGMIGLLK